MVIEDLSPDTEAVQIIDFSAEHTKWKEKKKKGSIQAEFKCSPFACINERKQRREAFHPAWNVLLDLDRNISPWAAERKAGVGRGTGSDRGTLPLPPDAPVGVLGRCLHCSPATGQRMLLPPATARCTEAHGSFGEQTLHIFLLHNSPCKFLPAKPGYGSPRSPSLLHKVKDAWVNTFSLA